MALLPDGMGREDEVGDMKSAVDGEGESGGAGEEVGCVCFGLGLFRGGEEGDLGGGPTLALSGPFGVSGADWILLDRGCLDNLGISRYVGDLVGLSSAETALF